MRLELNAILLSDAGSRVLFVSGDLLFMGAPLQAAINEQASSHGIAAGNVVCVASHTHFAPSTDPTKPLLGVVNPEFARSVARVARGLVDTVARATPTPVAFRVHRVDTNLNVIRRKRWSLPTVSRSGFRLGPSIVMAPEPAEPRDRALDRIELVNADGRTTAVIWKYACHPVAYPESDAVTAEFPGVVRARMRERWGPVPVVFLQGFAGDVRPLISVRDQPSRMKTLRRGPTFPVPTLEEWTDWAEQLAASATAPGGETVDGTPIRVAAGSLGLSDIITQRTSPVTGRLALQRVSLGTIPEMLFVSAEVCSPYLRLFSASDSICVGYTGDVFGYLPSAAQVADGGYEASDFMKPFGLDGSFAAGFERAVVNAVAEMRATTNAG
jgi:hypothetical protein